MNGFLPNSRWQNHTDRLTRSTNNGDMVNKAKRDVSEGVSLWHLYDHKQADPQKIALYPILKIFCLLNYQQHSTLNYFFHSFFLLVNHYALNSWICKCKIYARGSTWKELKRKFKSKYFYSHFIYLSDVNPSVCNVYFQELMNQAGFGNSTTAFRSLN